ncbi:DNA polymerase III subunit delta [Actinobaculum suis]|uniref:DNA polymerase III subunit delta n=1 Tax=Actinobaculum suis TaxID=1657 RepID=UPI00080868A8|nr:DNA polymerase III subunit delta [Actinobaculum suis]OCA93659.1 DNA polymerase III subunit delta [Actinobaculum suis]OCA94185.1 DNA polymerase III subunit delta [Actinobaculum suis]
MARTRKKPQSTGTPLNRLQVAPVVLIISAEPVLAERAAHRLQEAVLDREPGTETVRIDAEKYEPGQLATATSPSLFSSTRFVLVNNAEKMTDAFLTEAGAYINQPADGVFLVISHGGGTRGKRLLDAIAAAGYQVGRQEKIKYDDDKARLVRADVAAARRQITDGAVASLVDALGQDLHELLSATQQIIADTTGTINEEDVRALYGGRSEVMPWDVADAAIAGQTGKALSLARHAFATRVDPVPIVSAMANKLRQIALVQVQNKMGPGENKMGSWQRNQALRELRRWTGEGLARAIRAVAEADADVKGASRDPQYAVERAIIRIGKARRIKQ